MNAYRRGIAAIICHLRLNLTYCIDHKEFAPQLKRYPNFGIGAFRIGTKAILSGTAPSLSLISALEGDPANRHGQSRIPLRRGAIGGLVKEMQCDLNIGQDVIVGPQT